MMEATHTAKETTMSTANAPVETMQAHSPESLLRQLNLMDAAKGVIFAATYTEHPVDDWRWDAGFLLIEQDGNAVKTHGYELLLDAIAGDPGSCQQLIERLRDALHQTNHGPFPGNEKPTPEEIEALLYKPSH